MDNLTGVNCFSGCFLLVWFSGGRGQVGDFCWSGSVAVGGPVGDFSESSSIPAELVSY